MGLAQEKGGPTNLIQNNMHLMLSNMLGPIIKRQLSNMQRVPLDSYSDLINMG